MAEGLPDIAVLPPALPVVLPYCTAAIVDQVVTDPWLRAFLDLECFVLSGMTAKDTICAGRLVTEREGGGYCCCV